MKEDREAPEGDRGEEAGVEPVEEPEIEAVEEPRPHAGREPEERGGEETGAAGSDETESRGVGESERNVDGEPSPGARDRGADEEIDLSRLEGGPGPEGGKGPTAGTEDGLELDRMEVRPTVGFMDEEVRSEAETAEPAAQEEEGPAHPSLLVILTRYWIWIVGFLAVIAASSLALWFVSTPRNVSVAPKVGMAVHVVSASLGGEHYVRFNLYGPFGSREGEKALERALPKIRHELILSGGRPDVMRSIQENDLYFLEKHILEIVSRATAVPVASMDLKGLSVVRYSDQEEVSGEKPRGHE